MPPRIALYQCIKATNWHGPHASKAVLPFRCASTKSSRAAPTAAQKRKHRDPYALARVLAKKAANIARREELDKQRAGTLGDPIRGRPTSLIASLSTAERVKSEEITRHDPCRSVRANRTAPSDELRVDEELPEDVYLNHFLRPSEVVTQLEKSRDLCHPIGPARLDDETNEAYNGRMTAVLEAHNQKHKNAEEAIRRIIDLKHGNFKDVQRVNVQRCISLFGRHQTDQVLPPKAQSVPLGTSPNDVENSQRQMTKRAGPDTGSSEVQIAILTSKIQNLANFVEARGRNDKVGKRDLRLLVHRRQKLLKYLHRKERAGPRWQRCIQMLGLTDATWKGEITT